VNTQLAGRAATRGRTIVLTDAGCKILFAWERVCGDMCLLEFNWSLKVNRF
jgi:hypothetical protein